jgi:hypothetical protein
MMLTLFGMAPFQLRHPSPEYNTSVARQRLGSKHQGAKDCLVPYTGGPVEIMSKGNGQSALVPHPCPYILRQFVDLPACRKDFGIH